MNSPISLRNVVAASSVAEQSRHETSLRHSKSSRALPRSGLSEGAAGRQGVAAIAGSSVVLLACGANSFRRNARRRRTNLQYRRAQTIARTARPYELVPHEGCGFGASVRGFDIREALGDPEMTKMLREDMAKHRLVVFHGQTELTGEDHIALSEQLGSLDHGLHKPHPKAPDPRLLRVSNDRKEGFIQIGTSGWHIDGVMLRTPFVAQTMHFLSATEGGDTLFLGLNELLASLDPEDADICRRLWFVGGVFDDMTAGDGQLSMLPLVCNHPVTGEETMCFHLGRNYCIGWIEELKQSTGVGGLFEGWGRLMAKDDAAGPDSDLQKALRKLLAGSDGEAPERFDFLPPEPVQQALQAAIDKLDGEARQNAIWRQKWRTGDLALMDNLALAHLPTPGTQAFNKGLRLFHRTTMVDPDAMPTNARGAPAVLLAGGKFGNDQKPSARGAFQAPKAMRYIISALNAVTPIDERGGETRTKREAPARDELIKNLQEGGYSLALLDQVDEKVKTARLAGQDALSKTLKGLLLELHPDKNPGKDEVVLVFKYLRELRKEQGKTTVQKSVKDRLREKARKKTLQPQM